MFNLTTAAEQARFLIALGYKTDRVATHLRTTFPTMTSADLESVIAEAVAQYAESQRQLDAAIRTDDQRAVAAEHDLNRSMHP